MALADYGFGTTLNATENDAPHVMSLDRSNTRSGYRLSQSAAAAGAQTRVGRAALSTVMALTGVFLMMSGDKIVSAEATGAWLLYPIGLYLVLAGMVWLVALSRRPQELLVDKKGRAFHIVKCNWRGQEKSRQTIRFEEVVKLTMIDHLASLDMRANTMKWDMGRIDVTWQQNKVTPMITGDVAELEPLLGNLRREVGMG